MSNSKRRRIYKTELGIAFNTKSHEVMKADRRRDMFLTFLAQQNQEKHNIVLFQQIKYIHMHMLIYDYFLTDQPLAPDSRHK